MGVVVRRYIDILTIIINFPYSTCISSLFGSSIPTSLFIFKMFFRSLRIRIRNGDFLLHAARTETVLLWRCYTLILLEISSRTRWWYLKCVIVCLARDIPPFVMYCINGKPRSSLLIESTDSMIWHMICERQVILKATLHFRLAV